MFKTTIRSTPFTTEQANDFFQHISGESFRDDYSFVVTLRALVAPRMNEDDRLYVRFQGSSYSAASIPNNNATLSQVVCLSSDENNEVVIHNFTSSTEDNHLWMEYTTRAFCDCYSGFHVLDNAALFFRKKLEVVCFVNPERRMTVIFTNNMDTRTMHYLQCGIFAFLPWYFDPAAGVSEDEMELIESLREKTSQRYEQCLVRMAEKYDFKSAKIRRLLAGFESRYERLECDRTREFIADKTRCLSDYNNIIGELLAQRRDLEIKLLGLEAKLAQDGGDSELMEYFLCNNKLVLENVNNTAMVFGVKDYLTYFDEEMAQHMIDNPNSYIYKPRGERPPAGFPAKDIKKLMTAIFIDQTLKIKFCAAYEFHLTGNVKARKQFSYGFDYGDSTPNPHIDRFSCLGSYERQINSFLMDNNYIGAIEQCVASCKSLNFSDSTVMAEFMKRIYGTAERSSVINIKCIELPDGSTVAPKEAILYLNKEEETANG